MRKLALLLLLALPAGAQTVAVTSWPNGSIDLNNGWRSHSGDNSAWAQPAFDDSSWSTVTLGNQDAHSAGWRWYRLRAATSPAAGPLALLITGGAGTYEVYVNGRRMPGPHLLPALSITYPRSRVVPLPPLAGAAVIALRTFVPPTSMFLADRGAFRVELGTLPAIDRAHRAEQSTRVDSVVLGIGVHLLLILAGISALVLFWHQRDHREYLWLGLYLILDGSGTIFFELAELGFAPFAVNWFAGAPSIYLATIAQIEFTFSFVGQRVTRGWRVYEWVLLIPPVFLVVPAWFGVLSRGLFNVDEILLIVPAAVGLPILLLLWYRRGYREAGWLIFPSLLPVLTVALNDVGIVGAWLGSRLLATLGDLLPVGILSAEPFDFADLLFLLAIGVVMFFRFTRVSQEQARTAAELEAAQRVQSLLLRAAQSPAPPFHIDAVYRPAQEVGGDFFHTARFQQCTRIVVGDVSGKGLGAAMLVSAVIGALDSMPAAQPAAVLRALNHLLLDRQQGGFATCLCALVDASGALTLANAGHLAPYRKGEEMNIEPGLPLGVAPETDFVETQLALQPGDTLTFLSDGVVEARSAGGELFGFERTRCISDQSAEQIAHAAQAHGQEDDITVLTLTFAPIEAAHA